MSLFYSKMFRKSRLIFQVRSIFTTNFCERGQLQHPLCRVPSYSPTIFRTGCTSCPKPYSLPVKADVKMNIQFSCKICGTRNNKYFSKTSYMSGVVIIRCDGCQNNHLIADHLNWFPDVKGRNIEEILAQKGVKVQRNASGDVEFVTDTQSTSE